MNLETTCDYVSFTTILTTINYLLNFYDYFAMTLRLLKDISFHVDDCKGVFSSNNILVNPISRITN